MEQKRSRGRPKGTQINDGRYLDMVADLMVKEPDLKKTPAITRVVVENFPEHQHSKVQRRLLRKWNETGDERLAAARERRIEARSQSMNKRMREVGDALAEVNVGSAFADQFSRVGSVFAEQQRIAQQLEAVLNPPALKAIQSQIDLVQQLQDSIDPPALRRMREQAETIKRLFKGY